MKHIWCESFFCSSARFCLKALAQIIKHTFSCRQDAEFPFDAHTCPPHNHIQMMPFETSLMSVTVRDDISSPVGLVARPLRTPDAKCKQEAGDSTRFKELWISPSYASPAPSLSVRNVTVTSAFSSLNVNSPCFLEVELFCLLSLFTSCFIHSVGAVMSVDE